MHALLAIVAPFALMLPLIGNSAGAELNESALLGDGAEFPSQSKLPSSISLFEAMMRGQTAKQVRIERRVTIRIAPQRSGRNDLLAQLPQDAQSSQFEERNIGNCVAIEGIAGVQTDRGNRLLLFLRDRRLLSVNLEKACRSRDFYSGFYVERNEDGKLCVDRDKLQSRSGAKCEIERMRQLVAVKED